LAGVGLIAVRSRHRGVLGGDGGLGGLLCPGLASVGLFYMPAAVALVIAVVGWRHVPSPPLAADGARSEFTLARRLLL